jgi:protein-disulfide isomerase
MNGSARLVLPVDERRDHIIGPSESPVTLVEYGDFQCPFCARAHASVQEVLRRMNGQMRLVFRHFPLATIHPYAQQAAEASEAAGSQGRFWEMHDLMYENQERLANPVAFAEFLDLDVERFIHELSRHAHAPRVRQDFISGVRSGVNGTPTFFINGVRHDGGWDPVSLMDAIEEEIGAVPRRW